MDGFAKRFLLGFVIVAVVLFVAMRVTDNRSGGERGLDGAELVAARCGGCHEALPDGGFYRISTIRKTPEGWDMTLVRMMQWHGVEISGDERAKLVKYFADAQGLAPSETAGYRYALERDLNRIEEFPSPELEGMCARCHTFARVALQRRDESEWLKLAHMHIGQWPGTEHQEGAYGRNWFDVAREETAGKLGAMFPLSSQAWSDWQARPRADLSGSWRLAGERPGYGRFTGNLEITALGDDRYTTAYTLNAQNGNTVEGAGEAIVYTGYEWRGVITLADEEALEVFTVSADGNTLAGRRFPELDESRGIRQTAVRIREGQSGVVAVEPPYLRTGEETELTVHGFGLEGEVSLGEGVEILAEVARDGQSVTVRARAAKDAAEGYRDVGVGGAAGAGLLTVYYNIDAVRVVPAEAVARVGGGGGPVPPVNAQFGAVAYVNGPDGRAGTDDDIRIGLLPATWTVANFDETAERDADVDFTGTMTETGLFKPAEAGVADARYPGGFAINNVGNLTVLGTVDDGGRAVQGTAHLIVTVQRWNSPPIR